MSVCVLTHVHLIQRLGKLPSPHESLLLSHIHLDFVSGVTADEPSSISCIDADEVKRRSERSSSTHRGHSGGGGRLYQAFSRMRRTTTTATTTSSGEPMSDERRYGGRAEDTTTTVTSSPPATDCDDLLRAEDGAAESGLLQAPTVDSIATHSAPVLLLATSVSPSPAIRSPCMTYVVPIDPADAADEQHSTTTTTTTTAAGKGIVPPS